MNRREFVVGSAATLVVTVAGGSYVFSRCPLDTEDTGVCTGPCLAFIDWDGDGNCDRVPAPAVASVTGEGDPSQVIANLQRACPFGLVNDPYPGQCRLYVDEDGDGFCDLSQGEAAHPVSAQQLVPGGDGLEQVPSAAAGSVQTACPLGLVNDPHPGECRRYIDENGNGLCDLSEPALLASGAVAPLPTPVQPAPQDGADPIERPQTACPYGLVNDPYPGECRRYVDEDGNGLCDLSEPALVAAGVVVAPAEVDGSGHQGQGGGQGRGQGRRRGQ